MSQQELLNEFASLGPEGQRQVADFIAFLKQKKMATISPDVAPLKDLAGEPFVGIWKDRQDLSDSNDWVRNLRRGAW